MSSDSKDLLTDLRRVGFFKAADRIEALEGEVGRLRAELQMVLDEFGYSLPPDTKASIAAAIRAAAGGDSD